MTRDILCRLLISGFLVFAISQAASASEEMDEPLVWDFDVFLDGRKVGKHLFMVSETDGVRQVESDATFDVRVFLIPVYRYKHSAVERWSGNCLMEIDARTNNGGKKTVVSGYQNEAGFLLSTGERGVELPGCVMTFAYWNSEFLSRTRLLNPQTGEYVDVHVTDAGEEMLNVRGQTVEATRFKLSAGNLDLTLWYSSTNRWLALESEIEGGHVIRYSLS